MMETVTDDGDPVVTAAREVLEMPTVKEWLDSMAVSSTIITFRDATGVGNVDGGKVTVIPSANTKSSPRAVKI